MNPTESFFLEVAGDQVPVRVYRERRRSIRAYLGKECLIVRFPHTLSAVDEQAHWQRLKVWLAKHESRRPGALGQYRERTDYQDGHLLQVGQRQYTLCLSVDDRASHTGRLRPGRVLEVILSARPNDEERRTALRTLLSRLVAQDFLPEITRRVHELNHLHFRRPVKSVRLKYNHSNWGSCSHSGNLNLSTRLLFAPPDVIDYVIIHELAHLVELNHSDRFWNLVADAMPDYLRHEQWLKENGYQCDF